MNALLQPAVPTASLPLSPAAVSAAILGIFVLLVMAEIFAPARAAQRGRWPVNLGLGLINSLLVRLAAVVAPLAAASWAAAAGFGLFAMLEIRGVLAVVLGVVLMDCALYWQHRAMHRFGWAWALHRLHHADEAIDISTGVRFNPAEALLSMLYKSAVAAVLGLPLLAVMLFEAWIAVGSLIEHSNVRLPQGWDRHIRRVWVTPAMHVVHHSAHGQDHNHNFGFALAVWDHLFGTHQQAPSGARIGLPHQSVNMGRPD